MASQLEHAADGRFAHAVERLAASHAARRLTSAEEAGLPSMQTIVGILRDLEALLFPSYVEAHHRRVQLQGSVGDCCVRLFEQLSGQIARSLRSGAGEQDAEARGREIALELLEALPAIRDVLDEDADAAVEGDPAAHSVTEVILSYPSIRAIGVHRVAHFLHTRRVPFIPRMMSEHVHGRTGIDIHPGARIGPGLFIDHGTGVVVGETAQIGRRCKLYQGVTLGALSIRKVHDGGWNPPQRHPTLEDFVTVYAHATILGGDTVIGEGSVIGGNVWLTRSVPPQTKVLLDPPNLLYRSAPGGRPVKEPIDYQI